MENNFLFNYFRRSRVLLSSVIFTIPLFIIYEIGVISLETSDIPDLRNGADVLMRQILESFGLTGYHGVGLTYIFLVAGLIIYHRRNLKDHFAGNIYFLMFLESIIWSVIIYGSLLATQVLLSTGTAPRLIQQIVLAVGAGLYEELVFRVFLIHGISQILQFIFKWDKTAGTAGSIIIAAGLFSIFHFVGTFGDVPGIGLFIVRFAGGVVLGVIYVFRGFGIVAYAHSIYDLVIMAQFLNLK